MSQTAESLITAGWIPYISQTTGIRLNMIIMHGFRLAAETTKSRILAGGRSPQCLVLSGPELSALFVPVKTLFRFYLEFERLYRGR